MSEKPRLGISACLLGRAVRFDGGHKRDLFFTDRAPRLFDLVAVCPEVESGMPVPRPAIQLRQVGDGIRLVENRHPHHDHTLTMTRYAESRVAQLCGLDGFVFKKGSPSCGMERVPLVINDQGMRQKSGTGLFSQAFQERWPEVPVEEEGRLQDPVLRENFFERVYAHQRWRLIADPQHNVAALIEFHARHKLMLLARSAEHYRRLGRLVAGTTRDQLPEVRRAYFRDFMQTLALRPNSGRVVNVLMHVMGYFKRDLAGADKQELLALFEAYRRREVSLITPVTLLRHHLRNHPQPWLCRQYFLEPCPPELALRVVPWPGAEIRRLA